MSLRIIKTKAKLGKKRREEREREMKKGEGINIGWVHLPTGERLHLSRD